MDENLITTPRFMAHRRIHGLTRQCFFFIFKITINKLYKNKCKYI